MTEQEKQAARIAGQIIEEREHLTLRDSLHAALNEEDMASPERLAYVASVIEQVDARLKQASLAPDERTTKEAVFYGLETFDNWELTNEAARDAAIHTCLMLGVIDEAEADRSSTQYLPSADPELHAEEMAIAQAETIGIAQVEQGADNPTYRIADHASAAIEQLAAALPDAERPPLHRDETEQARKVAYLVERVEDFKRAALAGENSYSWPPSNPNDAPLYQDVTRGFVAGSIVESLMMEGEATLGDYQQGAACEGATAGYIATELFTFDYTADEAARRGLYLGEVVEIVATETRGALPDVVLQSMIEAGLAGYENGVSPRGVIDSFRLRDRDLERREPLPDNDPTPPRGNGGAAMARPDHEPTEAEITRHMMTGEDPRTVSPLDKSRERNNTPEAKAERLAQRQTLQARGYDGPEL